jgi:hypothetical protein
MPSEMLADTFKNIADSTAPDPNLDPNKFKPTGSSVTAPPDVNLPRTKIQDPQKYHTLTFKIKKPLKKTPVNWTVSGNISSLKKQLLDLTSARDSIGQVLNKLQSSSPQRKIQLQNYTFHQNKINALSARMAIL